MQNILEGKTAIVTGGASGLGLATVKLFLKEGAQVVIADIQEDAGRAIAKELGEKVIYVHTDVTDEESVKALIASAVTQFGKLDIMFNNAGSVGDPAGVTEISLSSFDKLMQLDVNSVLFGHKYAALQFKKQGSGGAIITTASIAAIQGGWSSISYTTAKHAIVGLIRHAAKELSPFGIRTNAVAPGVIMTPLISKAFGIPKEKALDAVDYITDRLGAKQAMGRYGTADDIANTVLYLASELSSYVNGVVIPVDGGITAYTLSTSDEEIAQIAQDYLKQL